MMKGWEEHHPPLVIGLCGRARHGKDSVALIVKAVLERYGCRVFHSSISEIVLEEAQLAGLIPPAKRRSDLDGQELAALVSLGHEGRARDEDFWLEKMARRIIGCCCVPPGHILGCHVVGGTIGLEDRGKFGAAIIPGIRFPNEIEWLKKAGGWLVKVSRMNADGSEFISPDRDPNDPMETVLNRALPDLEIRGKTGQEQWLGAQARSLALFLMSETKELRWVTK